MLTQNSEAITTQVCAAPKLDFRLCPIILQWRTSKHQGMKSFGASTGIQHQEFLVCLVFEFLFVVSRSWDDENKFSRHSSRPKKIKNLKNSQKHTCLKLDKRKKHKKKDTVKTQVFGNCRHKHLLQ